MNLASIQIRQLTADDFEAFLQMDTGIEDDYVARIFPHSVNHETMFGAFSEGRLVSLAAYTVFADHYAILGRLRTDKRFREQGFSTKLLRSLCRIIDESQTIRWVGLATELNNSAVHQISRKLGFSRLSVFTSNVLKNEGMEVRQRL